MRAIDCYYLLSISVLQRVNWFFKEMPGNGRNHNGEYTNSQEMKQWKIPEFRKKPVRFVEKTYNRMIWATMICIKDKIVIQINSITDPSQINAYTVFEKCGH